MTASSGVPTRVIRYGVDADLPARRTLHAGPVSAVLENADLRYVRFGDTHIVLRLYMAVRDRNWSTIPATFRDFTVDDRGDAFTVTFSAEHRSADVDFAWTGRIEGGVDGTIRYQLDGAPRTSFLKNRIGFCVLHPMELAGLPATVVTPEGVQQGEFPVAIMPDQPFIDMTSISHPAGEHATVTITFEGDLFEVEDQRNWTDASYKTYGTPLRYPYPVEVTPADRIQQTITISFAGEPTVATSDDLAADVTLGPIGDRALPPIGFGAGKKGLPTGDGLESIRALRADHLWIDLDLGADDWRARLANAVTSAGSLGVPLDLSVIGGEDDRSWDELARAVGGVEIGHVYAFPPVTYPITFPRSDLATHPETVAAARAAFVRAGSDAAIGGGTRAYFTELNRAQRFLPVSELDSVTYTINAQVHASDNLSVVETLAAQGETVRSARTLVGDTPLRVGPVTLKPPYNPNATAAPAPAGPGQLPDPVDPRQLSLLAAGWTVGSIHQLAAAGADTLTYYDLIGWRGLREKESELSRRDLFPSESGQLFPLYHVFAALAPFRGGRLVNLSLADGLQVEALAVADGNRLRVLIASFSETECEVTLAVGSAGGLTVRMLDETSWREAGFDPGFFTTRAGEPVAFVDGNLRLAMRPFAVACLDGVIARSR